jgi:hypothetical protein
MFVAADPRTAISLRPATRVFLQSRENNVLWQWQNPYGSLESAKTFSLRWFTSEEKQGK